MSKSKLQHLAIIPDGNRRWSVENKTTLQTTYLDSCTKMFKICQALLEQHDSWRELSLFYISVENLRERRNDDLDPLFTAGHLFLDLYYSTSAFAEVELRWIGLDQHDFPINSTLYPGFVERIRGLKRECAGSRIINVLMGYDVRHDIEAAMAQECCFKYENLSVTRPVDLIIRSGGHYRLSGFLPLMCQYADFEFLNKLFPDVEMHDINDCIARFHSRQRNFGA